MLTKIKERFPNVASSKVQAAEIEAEQAIADAARTDAQLQQMTRLMTTFEARDNPLTIGLTQTSLQRFVDGWDKWEHSANAYKLTTFDAAEAALKATEDRYKIFTWVSYVLFVFGWSLGLAGKLAGFETETEAAE